MIVTEGFVSWREESILEEAWSSRGPDGLKEQDFSLWKSCVNRGADVKNVFWLRELRAQFATDTRERARENLQKNQQTVEKEASRLGVTLGGGPQLPGSPEADAALKEQQQQASDLKDAKDVLQKLRAIVVGYDPDPALGGTSRPGGAPDEATKDRVPAQFDPEKPPQFPPNPGEHMASWGEIAAVHKDLTLKVSDTLNRNPALYALMAADTNKPTAAGGSDALAVPNQSAGDARAKLGQAFGEVLDDIKKTQDAINGNDLGFQDMHPIHQTFFSTHPTYSKPFPKAAAQDYVVDEGGKAETAGLAVTVAVMVLNPASCAAFSGDSVAQQPVRTVRRRSWPGAWPRPAALRELRAAVPVTVQEFTTWRSASAREPTTSYPAAANSRARRSISAWLSLQPRLVKWTRMGEARKPPVKEGPERNSSRRGRSLVEKP